MKLIWLAADQQSSFNDWSYPTYAQSQKDVHAEMEPKGELNSSTNNARISANLCPMLKRYQQTK